MLGYYCILYNIYCNSLQPKSYSDTMGPGVNTWLLILLAIGWASGLKTKMCEHQEIVEAIKKTYSCALDFWKDLLNKGLDLANAGQYIFVSKIFSHVF